VRLTNARIIIIIIGPHDDLEAPWCGINFTELYSPDGVIVCDSPRIPILSDFGAVYLFTVYLLNVTTDRYGLDVEVFDMIWSV